MTPLQIHRRPDGAGGTYDPTGPDELNQLQRLIDYGVITGMASPADVVPLEAPQGKRSPRNDYEVKAQAYLLGNCSHCHNPRGFPTIKSPVLKDLLDFLPSTDGGIFQFPLDRMSPLRKRGPTQSVSIPYITPSLRDRNSEAQDVGIRWKPKYIGCGGSESFCDGAKEVQFIDAPWRSLIYRNVDTPFIYAEDYSVFPHMPRNSAGFDCRLPRIVGDWMVSIPAKRKNPAFKEDNTTDEVNGDNTDQPYLEVIPGDPDYVSAQNAAAARLQYYRAGKRYSYCPVALDIVDDKVDGVDHFVPADEVQFSATADTNGLKKVTMIPDSVPDKPHWVTTDLREPPIDWEPRRGDWPSLLVDLKMPQIFQRDFTPPYLGPMLQDVRITDGVRRFAETPVPMGLWSVKDECDFAHEPKVSTFKSSEWHWLKAQSPDAPVYAQLPGEAVYSMVCINCHGPEADSKGLMAETIAEMSGGITRVANFRDGLYGPRAMPGANIQRAFGPVAQKTTRPEAPLTAEDWLGRYVAFMALGGTKANIDKSILAIVGTTMVVGERRVGVVSEGNANMLQLARELCRSTLPLSGGAKNNQKILLPAFMTRKAGQSGPAGEPAEITWELAPGLIGRNGDAQMWASLCSLNNPVVRVPVPNLAQGDMDYGKPLLSPTDSFYRAKGYPAAPIMNHRGDIDPDGVHADNLFPLCIRDSDWTGLEKPKIGDTVIPPCAPSLFEGVDGKPKYKFVSMTQDNTNYNLVDADLWAARGAANAALAVVVFMEKFERGEAALKPAFDKCEKYIPKGKPPN
jgi:mono/diheme cytochrome c family protein